MGQGGHTCRSSRVLLVDSGHFSPDPSEQRATNLRARERSQRGETDERPRRRFCATGCDQRVGHRGHLQGARRARRAVRARRRRRRHRRGQPRPTGVLRGPAPARHRRRGAARLAARPLHPPRARRSQLRPFADADALHPRVAPRCVALRRVARRAHRVVRPAQLRPLARDGDRAQHALRLAVHARAPRPRPLQDAQRRAGPPSRRRGAPRSRRTLPECACVSATTPGASAATSSR